MMQQAATSHIGKRRDFFNKYYNLICYDDGYNQKVECKTAENIFSAFHLHSPGMRRCNKLRPLQCLDYLGAPT
eukprot:scaffold327431_cov13-Prasinocladus_malaysianus.AAC.1